MIRFLLIFGGVVGLLLFLLSVTLALVLVGSLWMGFFFGGVVLELAFTFNGVFCDGHFEGIVLAFALAFLGVVFEGVEAPFG